MEGSETASIVEALDRCQLFGGLTDTGRHALASRCLVRRYAAGERPRAEGERFVGLVRVAWEHFARSV